MIRIENSAVQGPDPFRNTAFRLRSARQAKGKGQLRPAGDRTWTVKPGAHFAALKQVKALYGMPLQVLFACLAMLTGSVCAQSGEKIAKAGNAAGAPACVTCHGPSGQGQSTTGFPRLAGMNAGYLVRQLQNFQDGARVNPIMGPVAKLLSAADRQALATYYAGLPAIDAAVSPAATATTVASGETFAQNGNWSKGLPACAQCHGTKGLGVGATFPKIAGQSSLYLSNQLLAWQAGTRKNDPMGLMHGIALKLSASDVSAVAAYYATLSSVADKPRSANP